MARAAPAGPGPGSGAPGTDDVARYSLNAVGWGAPTKILQEANAMRFFGRALYDLATLKVILDFDLKLRARISEKGIMCLAQNMERV